MSCSQRNKKKVMPLSVSSRTQCPALKQNFLTTGETNRFLLCVCVHNPDEVSVSFIFEYIYIYIQFCFLIYITLYTYTGWHMTWSVFDELLKLMHHLQ